MSLPQSLLAPSHLRMLRDADVAIVVGGGKYAYPAGLAAALMGVRLIPVATFGGAGEVLWHEFTDQFDRPMARLPARNTWDDLTGAPQQVLDAIARELDALPRLMLVHGRSTDRVRVAEILDAGGFQAPIVLREQFRAGQTIPEKFEREALQADAALVLFTPDDEAAPLLDASGRARSPAEIRRRTRARQNVSLEYGWFWGRLGRERVLLLLKGELELPSDLSGLLYESYRDSPEECEQAILNFAIAVRSR
jgi:Predicted nucleotide-binding protein containing TIR-like domain